MAQRVKTSIIVVPIVILVIILGGTWLRLALLALSLRGLYELFRAVSGKILPIHFAAFLFAPLYFFFGQEHLLVILTSFVLISFALMVIYFQKIELRDCLITVCGFFYVPFMLSFIYLVRDQSIYFAWLIFISAAVSDTCAYFVGIRWGRHKLTGTPSPKKSWEGCIGGVVGAAFVGLIYGLVVARITGVHYPMVIIAAMAAIFSQLGDLFASAIKRTVEIKDFGRLLPGHGGVLDRFDSIIVAAPVVYIVMKGIEYLWM